MKVIVKEAGKLCQEKDIPNTLEALQEIVGGYIETVSVPSVPNVILLVNDEGKLNKSKGNIVLFDNTGELLDVLFGTIIAVGTKDDEFVGLTDYECQIMINWLNSHNVLV